MTPIIPRKKEGFEQVIFAKNQSEYLPLPANTDGRQVQTTWKLNWYERLHIVLFGKLDLTLLTFGRPLQPISLSVVDDESWLHNICGGYFK